MSFDLHLQAFENGEEGCGNRESSLKFLTGFSYADPNLSDPIIVSDGTGFEIDVYCSSLFNLKEDYSSASFELRGFSSKAFSFIYRFANASEFMILNLQASGDDPMVILPNSFEQANLPDYFSSKEMKIAEINSGAELEILLSKGAKSWQQFRNKVVLGKE